MNEYNTLLKRILLKKAKGFAYKEKTEEFSVTEGKVSLTKRKVVTKHVLPDVAAVKALLELSDDALSVTEMTDEQLQVEKLRLIRLLKICDETSNQPTDIQSENDCDETS